MSAAGRGAGFEGRIGFAVGTGRCGTSFLARALGSAPEVAASAYRHPASDTFFRYCRWHGIAVDPEGFLATKEAAIRVDLREHTYSFESSGYLALALPELFERFGARFALLVRHPERVVRSYLAKGWYRELPLHADASLPPSLGQNEAVHHFFGRLTPRGEELARWSELSRVGRLAWYWSALNAAVLRALEALPGSQARVERLEDLDFDRFEALAAFLGCPVALGRSAYEALAASRPNARRPGPSGSDGAHADRAWSDREWDELVAEAGPLAERLGYALDRGAPPPERAAAGCRRGRLARAAARLRAPSPARSETGAPVLVYHGTWPRPPEGIDDHLDNVSPERLHGQLSRLARSHRFVPIDEVAAARSRRGLAAVTFDDAYRSLAAHALPILRDLGIPAAIFVNGASLEGRVLWRDKLRFLATRGLLKAFASGFEGRLAPGESLYRASKGPGWESPAVEAALDAFLEERGLLGELPQPCAADDADFIRDPLVCYGNHGHDHYVLASLRPREQAQQIERTRQRLAAVPGIERCRALALPFGGERDCDAWTFACAREQGYESMLLARNRLNGDLVRRAGLALVERVSPAAPTLAPWLGDSP